MANIVNPGQAPNDGGGDTLRDSMVQINARFQELLGTLSNRGAWAPSIAYHATPAREWVTNAGQAYVAITNHISGATFSVDLAAGIWLAVDLTQLISNLAATGPGKGANLVGFIQAGSGAVARTVQDKTRETVSIKDFGAVGDGVTDDTASFSAARSYLDQNAPGVKLIFPSGVYRYTESPNWAIKDAHIEAIGQVRLRYQGAGNALIFDAGLVAFIFNVRFLGNFIVESLATAANGYYVRSVHHSVIEGRVAGCGSTSAALRVEFAVCTEFNVRASINQEPWYLGAKPLRGLHLTQRNTGQKVSACYFKNPILEGIGGDGIFCDHTIQNTFIGGTSEGNDGRGIVCTSNSSHNSFITIDLEQNDGGDVVDAGNRNSYTNILSDTTFTIVPPARNCTLRGGQFNTILNDGVGTITESLQYSSQAGTFTGSGLRLTKRNVLRLTSNLFDKDQTYDSFVVTVPGVPNNTATTVITLPATGNNFYQVTCYSPGAGNANAFGAYAVVFQDGGTSRIVSQVNGTILSITLVGQEIRVTQTAGVAITVFAAAKAI